MKSGEEDKSKLPTHMAEVDQFEEVTFFRFKVVHIEYGCAVVREFWYGGRRFQVVGVRDSERRSKAMSVKKASAIAIITTALLTSFDQITVARQCDVERHKFVAWQ